MLTKARDLLKVSIQRLGHRKNSATALDLGKVWKVSQYRAHCLKETRQVIFGPFLGLFTKRVFRDWVTPVTTLDLERTLQPTNTVKT